MQPLLQWKSSITYYEFMFVASGIQQAVRMYHIAICGLPGYTIFLHIISFMSWFLKKVIEHKMGVLIFSKTFVWHISHSKYNCVRYELTGIHAKYLLFSSYFNKARIFPRGFWKILKYISWKSIQWELSCFMQTDGQTNITKK